MTDATCDPRGDLPRPGPAPALTGDGAGPGRTRVQCRLEVLAGVRPPAGPGQGRGEAPRAVEQGPPRRGGAEAHREVWREPGLPAPGGHGAAVRLGPGL